MIQDIERAEEECEKDDKKEKIYQNVVVYKTIQLNMEEALQYLSKSQIAPNIFKYFITIDPNETMIVLPDSRLTMFCEERDQNGILLNKDKQVQLLRYSMKSKKKQEEINMALLTMRQGEEAWFEITQSKDEQQAIKMKYFKIKVVGVQQPIKPIDLSTIENRLKQFETFRNDGRILFNKNQFSAAIKKYQKGINFMEAWPKQFDSDLVVKAKKKYYYLLFCSNIVQCQMELKEYQKAIMILEDILPQCRGQEFEIKNYYRIIASYLKCGETDRAERFLADVRHICDLDEDQQKIFLWLEKECKPVKKVKI